jgi:hypothetical protein
VSDKEENPGGDLFVAAIGLAAYFVACYAFCRFGFYVHQLLGWAIMAGCGLFTMRVVGSVIK